MGMLHTDYFDGNREIKPGQTPKVKKERCPTCGHLTMFVRENGFCPHCRETLFSKLIKN